MSQPAPTPNDRPAVWPQVIEDMQQRHFIGVARYGTALQPFNGRSALKDAYEEAQDLTVYLKQEMIERDAIYSKAWELCTCGIGRIMELRRELAAMLPKDTAPAALSRAAELERGQT